MSEVKPSTSREERLAAKLRENLRRRKEQSRDVARDLAQELAQGDTPALPKSSPDG